MLESILRPVGTCTTEERPVDLPPARSLPFSTPVSKVNSFVPDAEKASSLLSDGFTCAWARDIPPIPKATATVPARKLRYIGSRSRSDVAFPLPPALSLGERENGRQRLREAGIAGKVERLKSIPPLPRVESRGEGEQAARPSRLLDAANSPDRGARLLETRIVIAYTSAFASSVGVHPPRELGLLTSPLLNST